MVLRNIFKGFNLASKNKPEDAIELVDPVKTRDDDAEPQKTPDDVSDNNENEPSDPPSLTAIQEGQIELNSTLNDLRPDRYFIATRVESFSDLKLIIGGRSNSGGPIFSLVDPMFHESEYVRETTELGFGGLLGASEYPIYWETFSRLGIDKSLALIWNGSEPHIDFMLNTGVSFDYVPRGYQDIYIDETMELVPESLIIETYWPSMGPLVEFMRTHPPTDHLKRFLVGSPPPLYSNDILTSRLVKEPFFAQRAKDLGFDIKDLTITRPELRHKLWFTLQTIMAELAEQADWIFIPVPQDCFDEKGYLKLDLSAGDCVHANADFGRRINRKIIEIMQNN